MKLILWLFSLAGTVAGQSKIGDISVPDGYQRIPAEQHSFAAFLRELPLKPQPAPVLDWRGHIKKAAGDTTILAVIDWPIRGRKLEQCMDIIVRLYTTYLQQTQRQQAVTWPLPDGSWLAWHDWKRGMRPQRIRGRFPISQLAPADSSEANFERYLREIFEHSGTTTFYFALPPVPEGAIEIGDLFIKKGRRGHAVLVVDMATNRAGERMALIAQGDTPACEPHLLRQRNGSAWIALDPLDEALPLPIRKKMGWSGLRRLPSGGNNAQ